MTEPIPPKNNSHEEGERGINPGELFDGFEWRQGAQPEALFVNNAGFTEDQIGNWYMVRKARKAIDLDSIRPEDLYNADRARFHNSTEGNGLYVGNTPRAVERVRISTFSDEPSELYVCRIRPEVGKVLDATKPMQAKSVGQILISGYLSYKSISPAVVPLKPSFYDNRYGDAEVVTMRPLAAARALWTGLPVETGGEKIPARWAVVRNIGGLDVIAHRPIRAN